MVYLGVEQTPANQNPSLDTTGAFAGVDNNGPVFFIAGTTSDFTRVATSADRTFDVPAGKPLLIPMLNTFDTLDPASTEEGIMEDFRDSVTSLFATIDGVSIADPESPRKYRFLFHGDVSARQPHSDFACKLEFDPGGYRTRPDIGLGLLAHGERAQPRRAHSNFRRHPEPQTGFQ